MNLFGEDDILADPEKDEDDLPDDEQHRELAHDGTIAAPRAQTVFAGHRDVSSRFLDLAGQGRLPHGLIFAGPRGIGKATFAYRVVRHLLRHGNDLGAAKPFPEIEPQDSVYRLVASGSHPDLMTLEGDENGKIAVEDIRKVPVFARKTASEGGWRVVVIDGADGMNRNAQNALLKVLEEPPSKMMIILIAHQPGNLIPTIRSRTQVMNFNNLTVDEGQKLFRDLKGVVVPEDLRALAELSDGRPGIMLSMLENKYLDIARRVFSLLSLPGPRSQILVLGEDLSRQGQAALWANFQEVLIWFYQSFALARAKGTAFSPALPEMRDTVKLYDNRSLEDILEICENLRGSFGRINGLNLDIKSAVLEIWRMIEPAPQK